MEVFSAPLDLSWIITNRCNLRCRHCLNAELRNGTELTTREAIAVIKQIVGLKIFRVRISGGEPLERKDLFRLIDLLSKAKVKLSLFTNGTLITRNVAKRLAVSHMEFYTVSLDGASPAVHDAIRGTGSFVKSIQGIKNLIAQKCPVLIATTMTHVNYHDAEKIVLLARALGARQVQFVELMYEGDALSHIKDMAMTARERFELLTAVRDLKIKYGDMIGGSIPKSIEGADNLRLLPRPQFRLKYRECVAGTTRCAIRPDGIVAPCERLWFLKAGDVKKEPLRDIWLHSSVMQRFRKPFIIKKEYMPGCLRCRYLRPCILTRRCRPYLFFRHKLKDKSLSCRNTGVAAC